MFLFYAFVLVSVFNLSQLFSLSFCMFQMNYAFFNGKLYFFPDVHIHLIFLFKCICPTKQWWFLFCSSLFLPPDLFSLFSPGRYKFTKRGTNSEVCSNIFLFVYVILVFLQMSICLEQISVVGNHASRNFGSKMKSVRFWVGFQKKTSHQFAHQPVTVRTF